MNLMQQKRYIFMEQAQRAAPQSLLGRIVAFVVGIGVLVVSLFVGAVFISVVIGLALIMGIVIAIRMWWVKRQMERYAREHGDIEAEYTVIEHTETRRGGAGQPDDRRD